jgi:WD40 repeat protein
MLNRLLLLLLVSPMLLVDNRYSVSQAPLVRINVSNVKALQRLAILDLSPIANIAWSPDGEELAIVSGANVYIYDTNNFDKAAAVLTVSSRAYTLAFIPNSGSLLVNDSIYNREMLAEIRRLPFNYEALEVSPLGTELAYTRRNTLHVFDLATWGETSTLSIHPSKDCADYDCAVNIAFSPDGSQLAFSSILHVTARGMVDLNTDEVTLSPNLGVFSLTYTPQGDLIASYSGLAGYIWEQIRIADSETGLIVATADVYGFGLSFNRDGSLLVTASLDSNAPNPDEAQKKLIFYELERLPEQQAVGLDIVYEVPLGYSEISTVSFNPHGTLLAVVERAGVASIWGVLAQ